jgi:hypothetical protein
MRVPSAGGRAWPHTPVSLNLGDEALDADDDGAVQLLRTHQPQVDNPALCSQSQRTAAPLQHHVTWPTLDRPPCFLCGMMGCLGPGLPMACLAMQWLEETACPLQRRISNTTEIVSAS